MRSLGGIGGASFALALAVAAYVTPAMSAQTNDYPTEARADYVFACMKTHGDTQVALRQCSCSIDIIATLLPYDRYVAAQTVLSLAQVPGRIGAMFRSPEPVKEAVKNLRQAQAEAEVRCF
jgi:Sec7-like guanine-nucleotide exchange factor